MENRLLSGIAVAALGLLIVLVPVCIFLACSEVIETAAGGAAPMKCFWAGQAEIGIGTLTLRGGILLVTFRSSLIRIGVSLMTTLAGVLSLLVPTLLIGGCEVLTTSCRMMTFPTLYVLSASTVVVCAANAFYLWRRNHQSRVGADGQ